MEKLNKITEKKEKVKNEIKKLVAWIMMWLTISLPSKAEEINEKNIHLTPYDIKSVIDKVNSENILWPFLLLAAWVYNCAADSNCYYYSLLRWVIDHYINDLSKDEEMLEMTQKHCSNTPKEFREKWYEKYLNNWMAMYSIVKSWKHWERLEYIKAYVDYWYKIMRAEEIVNYFWETPARIRCTVALWSYIAKRTDKVLDDVLNLNYNNKEYIIKYNKELFLKYSPYILNYLKNEYDEAIAEKFNQNIKKITWTWEESQKINEKNNKDNEIRKKLRDKLSK